MASRSISLLAKAGAVPGVTPPRLKDLYAHSVEGRPRGEWQSLEEHLNCVAQLSADFAAEFGSSDWAWNVGLLHDFGKGSPQFQRYLLKENGIDDPTYDGIGSGRVNHSSAGAWLAEEYYNQDQLPFGRVLSYIIAGHHAGLPDYEPGDGGMGALLSRLEQGKYDLQAIRGLFEELKPRTRSLSSLPSFVKSKNFHFWVRILFSCLVDADFLDTERFVDAARTNERGGYPSLVQLKSRLDNHLADVLTRCPTTPVNKIRKDILDCCRAAAPRHPGLFALTVPTGGGKTLSGTAFALEHAAMHGMRRIIYVIPYTSIIEQTAGLLGEIFGRENIIEHHSNLDPERETSRTRLASENWGAPIIVTTNVQFFESLFAARGSRCRKLHNVVNSVVILDEAQLVPPHLLAPCVAALNELTRNYRVTVVLSTATQPPLPGLDPASEIVPLELKLYEHLRRTEIIMPAAPQHAADWAEVGGRLREHEQVLCVVNTRRDCYELYNQMPEGTIHLSALMCGQHRSRVIREIKTRLLHSEPLKVISTQLVEAGVDLDFPVVFRALTGLDSIVQAAGRCNREGMLPAKGRVFVFVPPRAAPRGVLHKGESALRQLYAQPGFKPDRPETCRRYFELFYSNINDTGESLLSRLTPSDSRLLDVAFRSVGTEFRLIDDQAQRPVFVLYEEGAELVRQLRIVGPTRALMRRLQRYTVNLNMHTAEIMQRDGLLEEVFPGFLAQTHPTLYSLEIGLDVFRGGLVAEDLIV